MLRIYLSVVIVIVIFIVIFYYCHKLHHLFILHFFSFLTHLGFFSRTFTNHRATEEGGEHFFNSSLPLPPASQTLRHQPGDYRRELTSAHSQQPDQNQEPLISKHKLLTAYSSLSLLSLSVLLLLLGYHFYFIIIFAITVFIIVKKILI